MQVGEGPVKQDADSFFQDEIKALSSSEIKAEVASLLAAKLLCPPRFPWQFLDWKGIS